MSRGGLGSGTVTSLFPLSSLESDLEYWEMGTETLRHVTWAEPLIPSQVRIEETEGTGGVHPLQLSGGAKLCVESFLLGRLGCWAQGGSFLVGWELS